jgi:hypothetical protein
MWLFARRKLFERVTDDRFVLVLRGTDASFDAGRARRLCLAHHAIQVIEGDAFV